MFYNTGGFTYKLALPATFLKLKYIIFNNKAIAASGVLKLSSSWLFEIVRSIPVYLLP